MNAEQFCRLEFKVKILGITFVKNYLSIKKYAF